MKVGIARRCVLAGIALVVAAALLRGQIALALIYRGDDAMSRGSAIGAEVYYNRALWLDPSSTVAADRLSFAAFMEDDLQRMRMAVERLDRAIAGDASQTVLRKDRALLELRLKQPRAAAKDLAFVGMRDSDAWSLLFAGILRARQGECRSSRALLERALRLEPTMRVARRRLQRSC